LLQDVSVKVIEVTNKPTRRSPIRSAVRCVRTANDKIELIVA